MDDVAAYHRELVARLQRILGDDLVGVYAGGSYALDDYRPGSSDLDVAVVARGRLARESKEALVEALRHESLPGPARGRALVVYSGEAAASPSAAADFELNLNTGGRMDFRAELEPGEEWHWFALDRAILRQRGLPLTGPPPQEVFGELPRDELLVALAEGLRWHGAETPTDPNTTLNALRTLRFVRTGDWTSKSDAAAWALEQGLEPEAVDRAQARERLDPAAAERVLALVSEAVAASRTS